MKNEHDQWRKSAKFFRLHILFNLFKIFIKEWTHNSERSEPIEIEECGLDIGKIANMLSLSVELCKPGGSPWHRHFIDTRINKISKFLNNNYCFLLSISTFLLLYLFKKVLM